MVRIHPPDRGGITGSSPVSLRGGSTEGGYVGSNPTTDRCSSTVEHRRSGARQRCRVVSKTIVDWVRLPALQPLRGQALVG